MIRPAAVGACDGPELRLPYARGLRPVVRSPEERSRDSIRDWLALPLPGRPPASAPALAQKKAPDGAKVLLLSGGQRQHHGYRDQAFYLTAELENTGRYEVTITEEAAVLDTPALAKYDVVVAIADRRDPEFKLSKSQQLALVAFVQSGKGYVSIHGADNAPADWEPEFKLMLGGVFSHFGLPDGKTRKGDYVVKIVDPNNPVGKGISDFPLKDELYYHLQMAPGVQPLAVVEFQGAKLAGRLDADGRKGPRLPHGVRPPRLRPRQGRSVPQPRFQPPDPSGNRLGRR